MDNIKPIPPFKRFCGSLGAFPEAFSDAMTVYEALEWLYRYINKEIVPKTNEAIKVVDELKVYIDTYFDNLDVQEEINNKLDAMVEDGTLAEIINQEIFDELNDKVDDLTVINSANLKITPIVTSDNCASGTIIELNGKNILVDFGLEANANNTINFILAKGITKFDYVIITHFDIDHIANVSGLQAIISAPGIDFSEAHFIYHDYISEAPEYYNQFYNSVNTYIEGLGYTIVHPDTEGQSIQIGETASLNFYNCSSSMYAHYDGQLGNDYCLITLIKINDYTVLLTADSEKTSEEYFAPELPYNINVIQVPHHGVNKTTADSLIKRVANDGIYYIINSTTTTPNRPYFQQAIIRNNALYTSNESEQFYITVENNILSSYCEGKEMSKFNFSSEIKANSDLNTLVEMDNYVCNESTIISTLTNMPPNYSSTLYANEIYIKNMRVSGNTIYQYVFGISNSPEIWCRKTNNGGTTWSCWTNVRTMPYFSGWYNPEDESLTALTWTTVNADNQHITKWTAPITLSDGGVITVGDLGIATVGLRISGNVAFTDVSVNDRLNVAPFINSNEEARQRVEVYANNATTSASSTFISVPFTFYVNPSSNTTIEVKARNVTNNSTIYRTTNINVELI